MTSPWQLAATKERVTQSDTELCVMLDIPEHARKQIHGWVLEQDWPEGTELHEPEEYHITLMYTPDGYEEHKDADWIEHMDSAHVKVTGIDVFPKTPEDRHPYVLRLDAPAVKERAVELQRRAEEDHGLEITHFDGGYKPHLTVGYGPSDSINTDDFVELEFRAGPSLVAPPRKDEDDKTAATRTAALPERGEESVAWKLNAHLPNVVPNIREAVKAPIPPKLRDASGKDRCGTCKMFDQDQEVCWGFGNRGADDDPPVTPYKVCNDYYPAPGYHESARPVAATYGEAQLLDDLSMRSVAHNLHYKYEQGARDPAELRDYANRLLDLIGYPRDDMNTMAALQAWQTMYPGDQVALQAPSAPEALQAPPTTPSESWGYGTVSGHRPADLVELPHEYNAGVHDGPAYAGQGGPGGRRGLSHGMASQQQSVHGGQAGEWGGEAGQSQLGDPDSAGGSEDGVGLLAGSRTARRGSVGWTSPELTNILDAFNSAYGATLLADETPQAVSFNHIEIPPSNRGNGVGSRLMNQLKAYADRHGKSLQVNQVANFPFFAQFPWLQPAGPDTFVYTGQSNGIPADHGSTEPTEVANPDDHWPEFGGRPEDERRHYDVSFGNDWI